MTEDQMSQKIHSMMQVITEIKTKQNNDHLRIEENKSLGMQIHKVSINLENLTEQLKGQNERMDKLMDTYDTRLSRQGERVGKCEISLESQSVITEKLLKRMDDVEADVDDIKTRGSKRLDGILDGVIGKVICVVLGAILMFILYQFGL